MHALFRLARYALTGAVLIAMGGVAFAGLGQPTPVSRLPAVDHQRNYAVRPDPAGHCHGAL